MLLLEIKLSGNNFVDTQLNPEAIFHPALIILSNISIKFYFDTYSDSSSSSNSTERESLNELVCTVFIVTIGINYDASISTWLFVFFSGYSGKDLLC